MSLIISVGDFSFNTIGEFMSYYRAKNQHVHHQMVGKKLYLVGKTESGTSVVHCYNDEYLFKVSNHVLESWRDDEEYDFVTNSWKKICDSNAYIKEGMKFTIYNVTHTTLKYQKMMFVVQQVSGNCLKLFLKDSFNRYDDTNVYDKTIAQALNSIPYFTYEKVRLGWN